MELGFRRSRVGEYARLKSKTTLLKRASLWLLELRNDAICGSFKGFESSGKVSLRSLRACEEEKVVRRTSKSSSMPGSQLDSFSQLGVTHPLLACTLQFDSPGMISS